MGAHFASRLVNVPSVHAFPTPFPRLSPRLSPMPIPKTAAIPYDAKYCWILGPSVVQDILYSTSHIRY